MYDRSDLDLAQREAEKFIAQAWQKAQLKLFVMAVSVLMDIRDKLEKPFARVVEPVEVDEKGIKAIETGVVPRQHVTAEELHKKRRG